MYAMKKKPFSKFLILLPMAVALSGCNVYSMIFGSNDPFASIGGGGAFYSTAKVGEETHDDALINYKPSTEGVYTPDSVLPYGYRDLNWTSNADIVPSTGDVKLLVLPIELSGYQFKSSIKNDLSLALQGNSINGSTGYWESLASYYEKASFGKLRLSFEIADIYDCGYTPEQAYKLGNNAIPIVSAAVNNYKKQAGVDLQSLDSDSNGLIDGVIAIYSCPDFQKSTKIAKFDTDQFFWAYCYWDVEGGTPNRISPNMNVYFWASYDFLYNQYNQIDAHTLIHEFGHMLGLDDYYPNSESDKAFFPTGWLDMMDGNILDHNCYSKSALGWTIPKVVDGSAEVEISASYNTGDCILIPSSHWNGSIWSEYILLELYSPLGLNLQDSRTAYEGRPQGFTEPGVKIYHVDSRVVSGYATAASKSPTYAFHNSTTLHPVDTSTQFRFYRVGPSNCFKDEAICPTAYSLIHLMEANKKFTFATGNYATNSSLFHAGSKFTLSDFSAFFPRKTTLNDGSSFPYEIEVQSVGLESAKIKITKA